MSLSQESAAGDEVEKNMNLFDPRTFSTDWEVMVVDKLERCVESEKLMGFAGILNREFDLPIHDDWNTLEFALGINSSFDQLWGSHSTGDGSGRSTVAGV
jgi:hypothetical protein